MDEVEATRSALNITDSSGEERPFRFLDLPKELRLMVYECLVSRSHETVEREYGDGGKAARSAILVTSDPVPPVYFTCKLIYSEAASMLKALDYRNSQPRVIIDLGKMKQVSLVQLDFAAWIAKCLCLCCPEEKEDWLAWDSYMCCMLGRLFYRMKEEAPFDLDTFMDFKNRTVDRLVRHGRMEGVNLGIAIQCLDSSDREIMLSMRELVRSLQEILGQRAHHKVTVYIAPDNDRVDKRVLAYDPTVLRIGEAIDKRTWKDEWM
ncbi:hypothetical protein EKO04_006934 [Ascochyta lentis]|uniref:Uncharacterized protein n=1 Tax=Ascochyta lentis TaxID=205686 RepID=A0A8H7J243_9PLEO|nr:hypothetical protein EKO04_006934 [Ascochyta lentis]